MLVCITWRFISQNKAEIAPVIHPFFLFSLFPAGLLLGFALGGNIYRFSCSHAGILGALLAYKLYKLYRARNKKKLLVTLIELLFLFIIFGLLLVLTKHARQKIIKEIISQQELVYTGTIIERKQWMFSSLNSKTKQKGVRIDFNVENVNLAGSHIRHKTGFFSLRFYIKKSIPKNQLMPGTRAKAPFFYYKESNYSPLFYPSIFIDNWPETPLKPIRSSWDQIVYSIRESLRLFLKHTLSRRAFGYCAALFLGDTETVDYKELPPFFSRWGIAHLLARSGLHIGLLIFLLLLILQAIPAPLKVKRGTVQLLIVFYALFSYQSVSFRRAYLFFLISTFSLFIRKRGHPLFLYTLVLFYALIREPQDAFSLSFQLSFFLTYALVLLVFGQKTLFLPHQREEN